MDGNFTWENWWPLSPCLSFFTGHRTSRLKNIWELHFNKCEAWSNHKIFIIDYDNIKSCLCPKLKIVLPLFIFMWRLQATVVSPPVNLIMSVRVNCWVNQMAVFLKPKVMYLNSLFCLSNSPKPKDTLLKNHWLID